MAQRKAPATALQQNYALAAVDDYNMRTYLVEHLSDKGKRDALIAEHRQHPRGAATLPGAPPPLQSRELARLIDKLRMVPQAGKHTIVETDPLEGIHHRCTSRSARWRGENNQGAFTVRVRMRNTQSS